ncbi:MAG TPA: deoxyribonuclease IV [Candidatus Limnocylindrales bacterium]|nr:deoxyribonuclease IV [Candidatus Limnocylindrales bacterium]
MLKIGCHLSASRGYTQMGKEALSIGANTFQFFTRNPRGGQAKNIDPKDVATFLAIAKENMFAKILAHAPYTLNPCASDERVAEFAYAVMADDMAVMENTPNNYYNFHPGNHVGQGLETGIDLVARLINKIMKPEHTTTILLETMSGKGTEIGSRFEELRAIIDKLELKSKVGICLDTCHVHDAGYDIIHDLDNVLDEFDRIIGLERLLAIHLNDSKNPFASHKDRHEKIGQGIIGMDTFRNVINHKKLRHLPFFLETPNDLTGYAKEISILKNLYRGS